MEREDLLKLGVSDPLDSKQVKEFEYIHRLIINGKHASYNALRIVYDARGNESVLVSSFVLHDAFLFYKYVLNRENVEVHYIDKQYCNSDYHLFRKVMEVIRKDTSKQTIFIDGASLITVECLTAIASHFKLLVSDDEKICKKVIFNANTELMSKFTHLFGTKQKWNRNVITTRYWIKSINELLKFSVNFGVFKDIFVTNAQRHGVLQTISCLADPSGCGLSPDWAERGINQSSEGIYWDSISLIRSYYHKSSNLPSFTYNLFKRLMKTIHNSANVPRVFLPCNRWPVKLATEGIRVVDLVNTSNPKADFSNRKGVHKDIVVSIEEAQNSLACLVGLSLCVTDDMNAPLLDQVYKPNAALVGKEYLKNLDMNYWKDASEIFRKGYNIYLRSNRFVEDSKDNSIEVPHDIAILNTRHLGSKSNRSRKEPM